MKKYIILLTIPFICSIILVACSNDDNKNHEQNNNDSENVDENDGLVQNENNDSEPVDTNNNHSQNENNNNDTENNHPQNDDHSETDQETTANETDEDEQDYESYTNSRFGFSVEYPSSFEADYMPANNDGIEVHDDEAVIIASGSHAGIDAENGYTPIDEAESIEAFYDKKLEDLEDDGYSISYKKLEDDWYVISYFDGTNNVYEKSIMDDNFIANLLIEYPADLQDEYGPIVDRVADTFNILKGESNTGNQ